MGKKRKNENKQPKGSFGIFDVATETGLIEAIQKALDDNIQVGSIENEPIFRLCQYFKGICSPSETPVELLEPFIDEFFMQNYDLNNSYDFDEVWLMFTDIWENDRVKYPKIDTFEIAKRRAERQTDVRPEISWCKNASVRKVDNLCYELQRLQGDRPFWISQYQAAEVMGNDPKMGRIALDLLERRNNLKRIGTGTVKGKRANTYHYIGQTKQNHSKQVLSPNDIEPKRQKKIRDLENEKELYSL